jgi:hypothetical protein
MDMPDLSGPPRIADGGLATELEERGQLPGVLTWTGESTSWRSSRETGPLPELGSFSSRSPAR